MLMLCHITLRVRLHRSTVQVAMVNTSGVKIQVVPLFGVPESLLSDRGTNLMTDLCKMLGTKKLNTTVCHPQS